MDVLLYTIAIIHVIMVPRRPALWVFILYFRIAVRVTTNGINARIAPNIIKCVDYVGI